MAYGIAVSISSPPFFNSLSDFSGFVIGFCHCCPFLLITFPPFPPLPYQSVVPSSVDPGWAGSSSSVLVMHEVGGRKK